MGDKQQTSIEAPGAIPGTSKSAPDLRNEPCSECEGSGKCAVCNGSGIITKQNEYERLVNTMCDSCEGDGVCLTCGGTGVESPE